MRLPVDRIAPNTALDEAVLMNSRLDIGGILLLSQVRESILDHRVAFARPHIGARAFRFLADV